MSGLGLIFLRRGGQSHPTAGSDYIKFADAEVYRILMEKGVSADGVGITKEDAASVTDMANWFLSNKTIVSFSELQYFTSLPLIGYTNFNEGGFANCSALIEVVLPSSVTYIGYKAFKDSGVTTINLDNIVTIKSAAFYNAASLGGAIYAPNLSGELSQTFYNCSCESITNLGIVEKIGSTNYETGVFENCKKLREATIPATCQLLGRRTFYNCTSLKSVRVMATTPPSCDYASATFTGCPADLKVYVPDDSLTAYQSATGWSNISDKLKPLSEYQG